MTPMWRCGNDTLFLGNFNWRSLIGEPTTEWIYIYAGRTRDIGIAWSGFIESNDERL